MATCNPQALLDSANCFDCLTDTQLEQVQVQMLCDLVNGTGLAGGPFVRISGDTMTGGLGIKSTSGLVVGSAYAGVNAAPSNGAIFQGNVGIGVLSPLFSLHVSGAITTEGTLASFPTLRVRGTDIASFGLFQVGRNISFVNPAVGSRMVLSDLDAGGKRWDVGTGNLVAGALTISNNTDSIIAITATSTGIGFYTTVPKSKLDIVGNLTVGATYGGVNAAPTSGAIIEGPVGIGTNAPDADAILDLVSTTKAFLPPRMTEVQRDAIPTPTAGMVVYNSTTNVLNFYNGGAWGAV